MAEVLIVDQKKQRRLDALEVDILELNKAEVELVAKQSIRANETTLLAKAISVADSQVVYAQARVDTILDRLQTLLGEASNDPAYSAAEKQQYSDAITNKEYV